MAKIAGTGGIAKLLLGGICAAALAACGSGDSRSGGATYPVGGAIDGVLGSGLVLQNNGGDDLAVGGLSFQFSREVADGGTYSVTVLTQPAEASCTIAQGRGTVDGAAVTDVAVNCRAWRTAQAVGAAAAFDSARDDMDVAADAAGNVIVVWSQSDGARHNIWSRRYTAGSGWGSAELLESDDIGDAAQPRLAVNGSGSALAAWQQFDGTRNSIFGRSYVPGAGWGPVTLIETNDTGDAYDPDVALDEHGDGMVIWGLLIPNQSARVFARPFMAGVWGVVEPVGESSPFHVAAPDVAFDAAGNAIAVWHSHDSRRYHVLTSRYAASSGWGAATRIENETTGYSMNARIAVDAAGNAVAVWEQHDDTRFNIWASRYDAATGWNIPGVIETLNQGDAIKPRVSVDHTGNVVAVWQQSDGTRDDIWAARYAVGSGWSAAQRLEHDNAGDALSPQVGVDADGNATVVWSQSDGAVFQTYANRFIAGIGWGLPRVIEGGSDTDTQPRVANAETGDGLAVWVQSSGGASSVRAARFE